MVSSTAEVRVDRLIAEVKDLTAQVKQLIELTPTRNKIWLRPSEFGQLIGVSYRQIASYDYSRSFLKKASIILSVT